MKWEKSRTEGFEWGVEQFLGGEGSGGRMRRR